METLLEAELFGIEERTATGVRGRRGKFEHAHDGTLFLDEVSDLSAAAQAKLLRAIQDLSVERVGGSGARRVDTRIIVATNRPLSALVEHGRFRLDLYLPVERRRRPGAAAARSGARTSSSWRGTSSIGIGWCGRCSCRRRPWMRCWRTTGRATCASSSASSSARSRWPDPTFLELDDLPPALLGGYLDVLLPSVRRRESMRAWGSRYARLVLERCGNNKRQACRELGISYHTLRAYLRFQPEAPVVQAVEAKEGTGTGQS